MAKALPPDQFDNSDLNDLLDVGHKANSKSIPKLEWKRPINVDVNIGLRVIGSSKDSFIFSSDEGDGYEITPGYAKGEKYAPELKPLHFEEWAEQLEYAVQWLRVEAEERKKG